MKRLCLVIPSIKPGGMERVMAVLANYFADNGLEVHLILFGKGEIFYFINPKVVIHEPDFYLDRIGHIYYKVKVLLFLRNKLKSLKPYSVMSFGEMFNSFVLLSALGLKLQIYVSDRTRPDKRWGVFHETLRRFIYPKAAGIIAQTAYSKSYLANVTGHQNIRVIPNPIKTVEIKKNKRKNVILFVGRLISTKRVDILLKLFSQSHYQEWELWIIGDGHLRSYLEDYSEKLGLSKIVKFWGNQREIGEFYQQSKIFAFTSVSEGFPNALLEAMTWGLACVSFDCKSGPSDVIIDNYNGFLIPLMDTDEFLQKLKLLQTNEDLVNHFSENAVLSSQQYTLEKIGQEYLSFIAS